MQKDSKTILIVGIIIAALIIGLVVYVAKSNSGPGKYDAFATCLTDQGAIFYGAFWCPHCLATKALFGKSAKLLDYVECSTPDGKNQTQICIDDKIEVYPTWVFKDGSRLTGEVTFEQLSAKTNCPINPGGAVSTVATSTLTASSSVMNIASTTINIK